MHRRVTLADGIDPARRPIEIVERKGLGHPDTICDALAEEFSKALCRYYVDRCGSVLHHNLDKALLFGGAARPSWRGGEVLQPIEIFLAGRATDAFRGVQIPVAELAEGACRRWLAKHFHALDQQRQVRIRCLTRPGSTDLVELFHRQQANGVFLANDTSCGVGFAPLSELERVVLEVETGLNSPEMKQAHPEIGEDIKVLAVRQDEFISLTLAIACVDRFVASADDYLDLKGCWGELIRSLAHRHTSREIMVDINTADDRDSGQFYLTVTGTSAEAGDDGQVGRGNRVNGLITPMRPMTMEASAGKNPITHVGKLYNVAARNIAQAVVRELPGVAAVECNLVSQIGRPIHEPQLAEIRLQAQDGASLEGCDTHVEQIAAEQLAGLSSLWRSFLEGSVNVY